MSDQAAPAAPDHPPSGTPAPAAPAPAVPAAPAHSKRQTVIGLTIIGLVIVGIAIVAGILRQDDPVNAKVGDCMYQTGKNAIEIVPCTDAKAKYKVVGRVENKSQLDADLNACDAFAQAQSVYWEGKQGEKGLVLCLGPVG